VQKILAACLIGTCIYLAEKALIQLISINYHRKQFNARIRDSKHNIWMLGLLYDASRYLFPMSVLSTKPRSETSTLSTPAPRHLLTLLPFTLGTAKNLRKRTTPLQTS